MKTHPEVEIVIPCWNEGANVATLLMEISTLYKDTSIQFIVVDNGSNDGSFDDSASWDFSNINIVRVPMNCGYGGGILAGLNTSTATYVGWMHADLQCPLSCVIQSIPFLQPRTLVKGRRVSRPIVDALFTLLMGVFESTLFQHRLWDINGQPTIFPRTWFQKLENPPLDFSLDLFVLVQARYSQLDVRRFDVPFHSRRFGDSSWNTGLLSRFKFSWRTIKYSITLRDHLRSTK